MLLPVRQKRNRRLTHHDAPAKDGGMKKLLLVLVATTALAACDKQDRTSVAGVDHGAAANAADVVLPPAITASKTYRCKDNSLVYIDWIADGTARVKAEKNEVGTPVKVGEANEAGGPSLAGTPTDASVTYNGKSCKG